MRGGEPAARGDAVPGFRRPLLNCSQLRQMVNTATLAIYAKSPDGRYLFANRHALAQLGWSASELVGRRLADLLGGGTSEQIDLNERRVLATESVCEDEEVVPIRGDTRVFRSVRGPLRNADGEIEAIYGISLDVTATKQFQQGLALYAGRLETRASKLLELSRRDGLTGLHNRSYFDETIKRTVTRQQRRNDPASYALILFDLDHFGRLNNHHGHHVGDVVLQRFAEILRARFRTNDLVARYGGEEFAVLLAGASVEEGVRAADDVRNALAAATIPGGDGAEVQITVSAGCAAAEALGDTPSELEARADRALRTAKRRGRNRVVPAPTLRRRSSDPAARSQRADKRQEE